MMIFGLLGSMAAGCGLPVNMIVFGNVVDMFVDGNETAKLAGST